MSRTALARPVYLSEATPQALETDLIIVPLFEGEAAAAELAPIDVASGGDLARALASREVQGKPNETFVTVVTGWKARRVLFVGAGRRADFTTERLRRIAVVGGSWARQRRVPRIAWLHRGDLDPSAAVQAAVEGLTLAAFGSDTYKSGERAGMPAAEMAILAPGQGGASIESAIERGRVLGECSNLSRELCNEPSNVLTPTVFAERARAMCTDVGLSVEVLDERQIAELKMGLLLGVARGSAEPPRMIVIEHHPKGASGPVLGLVGKGVTFDTGGISIKPAEGMDRMKDDMAGGAAVIAAMRAIALLDAPTRVIGIVPATENMPGGRAMKPGDVLTGASGKTVEVINTDAEGRLILGDALWYARQRGATHLVDVATLTGAVVVALGRAASAIFGQPESWVEAVRRTALQAGDRCWPMPLYDEYADQLKSEIADMVNSGGRPAGSCTAAMFLKEFAGAGPWVHLDVAGTAWAEEAKPWQPKGATGVAVRTLANLALNPGLLSGV